METTTVTTNGRVTIPHTIRKKYKIKPGTRVYFTDKNGEIIIEPITKELIKADWEILGIKGKLLKELMMEK